MLKNYLIVATRNLYKNRVFTILNILGLAFGLLCSILISFWVWDELRQDRFHINGQNIYQMFGEINNSGESIIRQYAPSSLVEPILHGFPEVRRICRIFRAQVVFSKERNKFSESGIYADPAFLSIFSFPLKEGNLENVLSEPQSLVITAELAEKYFPGESALGKNIDIVENERVNYVVTGVLENIPKYSSLQFDFVMGYNEFENKHRPWWKGTNKYSYNNFNVNVYLELEPSANVLELNNKLSTFIDDYTQEFSGNALFTYPFTEVYLHSDFSEGRPPTGKIQHVKLLSAIAIIVFLIACINFINLSTAIAGKRAKEVGLRKVVGASKHQLIIQFLLESLLVSVISMIIAITFVEILLPVFNIITHKYIELPIGSPLFIVLIIGLSFVTGILAGGYPAFILSSFKPVKAIINADSPKAGLSGMRKGLVILQFTMSISFIIYTLVVFNQIKFIQNKKLGIRKENILHHRLHGIKKMKDSYKNELLKIQGVQSVSFTEQNPLNISNANLGVSWKGKPSDAVIFFNVLQVGGDFLETFELELVSGSGFPDSYSGDKVKHFIINEAAARAMMVKNSVGMDLQVWGYQGKVIGVVRNYHHQSLAQSIEPMVIVYNPDQTWNAYISIETNDIPDLLSSIQATYSRYENEYAFDYYFVDEQYQNAYNDVITIGKLSNIFSASAIIISCLGLFGLSAFITEQKTKETGIRKVLGASEASLVYLFSTGFIKLIIISFAFAAPISWLFSQQWLSDYAYHIEIGIIPFVLAGTSALTVALLTIAYSTIHAAVSNPVDLLKHQ